MPHDIPAMTVTVQVKDGPTVCLHCDGRGHAPSRPIVPFTTIMISDQAAAPLGDGSLNYLLRAATSLLMLYIINWEKWPAELRPANPEEFRARLMREALRSEEDPPTSD